MTTEHREHFDKISDRYQVAADTWKGMYEQVAAFLNPLVQGKVVLDVGNGGKFPFDTNLPSKVIALDVSPSMLEKITDPAVVKVVSDAQDMSAVPECSVDVICCQLVLHHINGPTPGESLKTLERIVAAAHRRLRPGGRLVIVEGLLNPLLYGAQVAAFPLMRFALKRFGVSMIFFFRRDQVVDRLARTFACEPGAVDSVGLRLEGWMDPLGGSFPGVIKIPARLQPWDFRILSATKG